MSFTHNTFDPFKFDIYEVVGDMSNHDYHSRDEISSSFVKGVSKHSVGRALIPLDQEASFLLFGDMFHEKMELGIISDRFAIKPEKGQCGTKLAELDDEDLKKFGRAWGRAKMDENIISVSGRGDKTVVSRANDFRVEFNGKKYIGTPDGVFEEREDTSWNGSTTDGKEWKAANEGKIIMTQAEVSAAEGMFESAMQVPFLRKLLDNPNLVRKDEYSFFGSGDDSRTKGLNFRIRPDVHFTTKDEGKIEYIVDWKSAADIRKLQKWGFTDLGYDIQAVFYSDFLGMDPRRFLFVVVEKEPPYTARIMRLSNDSIDYAREKMGHAISRIRDWKNNPLDVDIDSKTLPLIIEI